MARPAMGTGRRYRVNFGSGAQGMRYRQPLSPTGEQAAEILNLWVQDGLLQNRPGLDHQFQFADKSAAGAVTTYSVDVIACSEYVLLEQRRTASGTEISRKEGYYVLGRDRAGLNVRIFAVDVLGAESWVVGESNPYDGDFTLDSRRSVTFTASDGSSVLADKVLFVGGGKYLCTAKSTLYDTVEFQPVEPYVPTVYINKNPDGSAMTVDGETLQTKADSFNLLSPRWRECFTPDGESAVYQISRAGLSRTATHTVTWDIPEVGQSFVFSIPTAGATAAESESDPVSILPDSQATYTVKVEYDTGKFTFQQYVDGQGSPYVPYRSGQESNNIVIEAEQQRAGYQPETIRGCTIAQWFGGSVQGLSSGTHLFLSGNNDYPGRVYWSAPLNPAHFPEENWNDAGAHSGRVIALARQGDCLVVFQESAVSAMEYDYVSSTGQALFVAYELNAAVGCAARASVRLIGNRLVWLAQDGGVYLLKSTSRQSESNVRRISGNIDGLISDLPVVDDWYLYDPKGPKCMVSAADYKGYYLLFVADQCYAWNYTQTPYVDSSDTERAQADLAWYVFQFPVTLKAVGESPDGLWAMEKDGIYALSDAYAADGTRNTAGQKQTLAVEKRWTTRLYDLDYPERYKVFSDVWVSFADSSDETVELYAVAETGSPLARWPIHPVSRNDRQSRVFHFAPRAKKIRMAGLILAGQGTGRLQFAGAHGIIQMLGEVKD